jgi:hypothetical protein
MSTRHINPEGLHRSPAFSQAVVVQQPAKTIYIGGQNGVDADGKVVGPTVGEQASQALRNLATILESEGRSIMRPPIIPSFIIAPMSLRTAVTWVPGSDAGCRPRRSGRARRALQCAGQRRLPLRTP